MGRRTEMQYKVVFSRQFLQLLKSYISDIAKKNDAHLELKEINEVVPLSCSPGPLLCLIYMIDLPEIKHQTNVTFAYDTAILAVGNDSDIAI